MKNDSHLTAITRVSPSVPTKYLLSNGLLKGRILDFGCGKGFDLFWLRDAGFDIDGFDPYYSPNMPEGKFDTVICNYVLNVLEPYQWEDVIGAIVDKLADNGKAYIAVRRDVKKEGYRRHGKGVTYQVNVALDLDKVCENSRYCIYLIDRKNDKEGKRN